MVKIYKQPFAHDGDAIAIPDASQPDGKMSSANGWTPDYQLPKTDPNYKPVGRQEMNGVFKEVTEALGQVQVQGSATWSPDGAPYPIRAQVYHNGKQWLALRANSVAPAEGADWTGASVTPAGQNIVVFDTSGTTSWPVPAVLQSGLLKAHVTVIGGGGGGARRSVSPGAGGGGGGGVAEEMIDLTGVTTVTVTVGAGGAGGLADGNSGVAGASSSFGAYCSATGGDGGTFSGNGAEGGVGVGGSLNYRLGSGNVAITSGVGTILGGAGGGGESVFAQSDNSTPKTPGMGGGGRTTGNGAPGANGIVIVRW